MLTTLVIATLLALTIGRLARATVHLPGWWLKQAACIHEHESTDWHKTTTWQGYPSRDHGGMQIDVGTWARFAPRGYPADPASATPMQQLVVAYLIWKANDDRWGNGQWPLSARACGLN